MNGPSSRDIRPARVDSTASASGNSHNPAVRERNSPGVCGPRSSSTQSDAELLLGEFQRAEFGIAKAMLVLRDAAAVPGRSVAHHVLLHQRIDGLLHHGFGQFEHRLAVGLLIAGVGEGVERQRILIRRGDFLLDQAADHARFVRREFDVHTCCRDGPERSGLGGQDNRCGVLG